MLTNQNKYLCIYRPIKTNRVTQGFGENNACAKRGVRPFQIVGKTGNACPVGYRDFYKELGMEGHSGIDHSAWNGEPLYFPVDWKDAGGWWSKEASDLDGGLGVDIISKKKIYLDGRMSYVKFRFWHLKKSWKDTDVHFGELIGYCDNTGASSASHLHWSMKRCTENGVALDKDNGYYGAVDFMPYFENEFVLDVLQVKQEALSALDVLRKTLLEIKNWLNENFNSSK